MKTIFRVWHGSDGLKIGTLAFFTSRADAETTMLSLPMQLGIDEIKVCESVPEFEHERSKMLARLAELMSNPNPAALSV